MGKFYQLIVGLGNPGAQYEDTRHNIGFMVLERMVQGRGDWRRELRWKGLVATVDGTIFLKPQTYMNLSGESVFAVARFYQIPTEKILVVYDDMSLGLGRLRFRSEGSAGGHNGMKSILQHAGTQAVARLKIGIGEAVGRSDVVSHVLGKFRKDEKNALDEIIQRSDTAIWCAAYEGIEKAMNAFN